MMKNRVRGKTVPLSELLENDTVGKSLSADTDSLQHPVTSQLVQNQVGVQFTSLRREGISKKHSMKKDLIAQLSCNRSSTLSCV